MQILGWIWIFFSREARFDPDFLYFELGSAKKVATVAAKKNNIPQIYSSFPICFGRGKFHQRLRLNPDSAGPKSPDPQPRIPGTRIRIPSPEREEKRQ